MFQSLYGLDRGLLMEEWGDQKLAVYEPKLT